MKIKYLGSVLLFLLCSIQTNAQQISRDSTRARGMRILQQQIQLSDTQVQQITDLTILLEAEVSNISNSIADTLLRRLQLHNKNELYRSAIRNIMTNNQWTQYQIIEQQRQVQIQQKLEALKVKNKKG